MWRRPHTGSNPASSESATVADASATAVGDAGAGDVDAGPVALSEVHVLGCHDRGSKKTPPDQCDRLPAVEAALSNAIEQAATCVSTSSSGGTIEYVANISFKQRKVSVALPRSGRSFHDPRTVDACAASVRASMQGVALDSITHEHARYRLSVVATYRNPRPTQTRPTVARSIRARAHAFLADPCRRATTLRSLPPEPTPARGTRHRCQVSNDA